MNVLTSKYKYFNVYWNYTINLWEKETNWWMLVDSEGCCLMRDKPIDFLCDSMMVKNKTWSQNNCKAYDKNIVSCKSKLKQIMTRKSMQEW